MFDYLCYLQFMVKGWYTHFRAIVSILSNRILSSIWWRGEEDTRVPLSSNYPRIDAGRKTGKCISTRRERFGSFTRDFDESDNLQRLETRTPRRYRYHGEDSPREEWRRARAARASKPWRWIPRIVCKETREQPFPNPPFLHGRANENEDYGFPGDALTIASRLYRGQPLFYLPADLSSRSLKSRTKRIRPIDSLSLYSLELKFEMKCLKTKKELCLSKNYSLAIIQVLRDLCTHCLYVHILYTHNLQEYLLINTDCYNVLNVSISNVIRVHE